MNFTNIIFVATSLFITLPAIAQSISDTARADSLRTAAALNRGQPTRVSVNFRMPLEVASGDVESNTAAMEKARGSLYAQAWKECSLIIESLPGVECRLENLQIMVQTQNNGMRQSLYLHANANYVLGVKSTSP